MPEDKPNKSYVFSEKSPLEDHYLSLYDQFVSGNSWMHEVFQHDDVDFLALPLGGVDSSKSNYRKWVGSVYGVSPSHDPNRWKDDTHIGGMKLRAKCVAMVAHLYQNLTKDGRVTGSLALTEESDVEEQHRKGKLLVNGESPPEEMVRQLVDKVERRLEKAEKQVLDHKQESRAEETYHQCIEDLAKYGVCAMELGIRENKRVRNYETNVISVEDGGQESLDLVSKPSFKDSFIVGQARVSPYNVFLDPHASGNPQNGLGSFVKERVNSTQVAEFLGRKGNWDFEQIRSILGAESSLTLNSPSGPPASDEGASSLQESSISTDTQPFILKKFWGSITSDNLDEWAKSGTTEILRELQAMLVKEHSQKDYDRDFSSFEVNLIFLNDKLIYASPNYMADRKRPLAYNRMIPVEDTNYGFGVMALGREAARAMSNLWSRSKDNATIVGSAMFTYDPAVVDEQTLIFRPGGKVRFKPGSTLVRGAGPQGGALSQLKFESVSAELMALFDKLELLLDELTLIPSNLVGVTQQAHQTATEVTQNLNSAQVILLDIRRSFDQEIISRDLSCTYHYLQNDPATEDEGLVDANITVYGAETFALQLLNKQMVTELLQMTPALLEFNPDIRNSFNWKNILTMSMEGIGFDKDKILNTPELSSQLDIMNQQLQEMGQQMEQMQQQGESTLKELEQTEKELDSTKLKNAELQAKVPVEARLNLEQVENKNLNQEMKNQRAVHEQELDILRAELKMTKEKAKNDKSSESKSKARSSSGSSKESK